MEWVNELRGKTIGLDTAPLIYFIEENVTYLEATRLFFEAMDRGDFCVSGRSPARPVRFQHDVYLGFHRYRPDGNNHGVFHLGCERPL